jgi:hypothetical protein
MVINTGRLPYLQKKVADLTFAASWLESEIKKKEYNLSTLNHRTRELTYRGDGMYSISTVYSTKALTYNEAGIYTNSEKT